MRNKSWYASQSPKTAETFTSWGERVDDVLYIIQEQVWQVRADRGGTSIHKTYLLISLRHTD